MLSQVVTNAKNILFIRTRLEPRGILAIMDAILTDMKSGDQKGARHIMRMLPVIGTCKGQSESLLLVITVPSLYHDSWDNIPSQKKKPSLMEKSL